MATKPTILLIPGSFSRSHMYDEFSTTIKSLGYPYEIADLPSSSRKPPSPAATLADDAHLYNTMLSKLCHEQGKNVIVLGHSYGGIVSTEAVKDFTSSPKSGHGKVLGIIYLTCLVPRIGDSLQSLMKDEAGVLDFIKLDGDFMYHDPLELSAKQNFSDLPLEKGIEWAKQFSMHSALSFAGEATYAGYEDVDKVAYVLCTKDETLKPAFQKQMIRNIDDGRRRVGKGECKVYEFESGHCPPASRPKDLAKLIGEIAGTF